jgi:hypothetical protein
MNRHPAADAPAVVVRWRALRPGELDHERLWLGVSLAAAVLCLGWLAFRLPLPQCAFRAWTGFPCLTCGTTRTVQALLEGNLAAAILLNPLAVLALAGIAVFNLYALTVLALRLPRLRVEHISARGALSLRIAAGGAVAINWAWLLWKRV